MLSNDNIVIFFNKRYSTVYIGKTIKRMYANFDTINEQASVHILAT